MKKLYSILAILPLNTLLAQTGLHFQFHKHSVDQNQMVVYHKDSIISLCKVGTVSGGNNSIALLNPNTNTCTYFNSPITPSVYPTMLMKNMKEGVITSMAQGAYSTNDGWQTSTPLSLTTYTPYAASRAGYITYNASSPYTVYFSPDAINWSAVLTTTAYPYFVKGASKHFILDHDRLHVSANGGSSFSAITFSGNIAAGGKLYAADDDSLFIIGANTFLRSTDGGNTWTSATLPSTLQVIGAACKNGREIMIRTINSQFTQRFYYYSNNAGNSWTQLPVATNFGASDVLCASSQCFMLYPSNKSYDGGASWVQLYKTEPNDAFDANFSGNTGLLGIDNGKVLVSFDKGASFNEESAVAFTTEDIMAVKVMPNKFLAADRKSNVWESLDNGQTWTKRYSNTTNLVPYKIMHSQNTNTIICVRAGQPLVSTDGGNSYNFITVGGGQRSQAQMPVSGNMIDVGGSYPAPNFTLTGWEFSNVDPATGNKTLISSITSPSIATESVLDIHMVNDNLGYFITNNTANGGSTTIYKTTNAWVNVTPVATIPVYYALARIQTLGTDTVLISGPNSTTSNSAAYYHLSVDGGNNWQIVGTAFTVPNNLLGNKVYKMHFFKSNEFIALISDGFAGPTVTSSGVYLQTSAAGGSSTIGIKELTKADDEGKIVLFPNPATDKFVVQSLRKFEKVEVYNLNGQMIATQEFAETEQAEIHIAGLQSGIYIIKAYKKNQLVGQNKLVVVN